MGEAQKVRHRQEWKNLSTTNKANRNAIFDEYRKRIKDAAALHRKETKPFWAAHFAKERDRKKTYDKREANLIGVIQNAFEATSQQYVMGELDGRGKLSAHFSNVISSQKRRAVFERRLDLDKQTLGAERSRLLVTPAIHHTTFPSERLRSSEQINVSISIVKGVTRPFMCRGVPCKRSEQSRPRKHELVNEFTDP